MKSIFTRHADAAEGPRIVEAAAVVLARVALALVDVRLAAWPGEALRAVAGEGAGRVDALAVVFAGRALVALVDVFGAVHALVAGGAGAGVGAVDGAGVADCVRVAWVRGAGVVQVAQQARFAGAAAADEAADAVDAGRPVEACRVRAVVLVDAAVGTDPAVHANARVPAEGVRARGAVLTDRRPRQALVHIVLAVLARVVAAAGTPVRVDPVDALAAVLAQVARTVVDVLLAVDALESYPKQNDKTKIISRHSHLLCPII